MYYYNTVARLDSISYFICECWFTGSHLSYAELSGRENISPRKCTQFKHPQNNHSDKTNRISERNLRKETDNRAEHEVFANFSFSVNMMEELRGILYYPATGSTDTNPNSTDKPILQIGHKCQRHTVGYDHVLFLLKGKCEITVSSKLSKRSFRTGIRWL